MNLFDWLQSRELQFGALSLELQFLLKETLGLSVLANVSLSKTKQELLDIRYQDYLNGVPLAYILATQPFLALELVVDNRVLIPRADTEAWVWHCIQSFKLFRARVLDIGTGSGCIALALKYYNPDWDVYGVDISEYALQVAEINSMKYNLKVSFLQVDLYNDFDGLKQKWDLIVSNPPYLDENHWRERPALHYEPKIALVDSAATGLSCYEKILSYARSSLKPGGELWLEHGYNQRDALIQLIQLHGFFYVCYDDLSLYNRVVVCTL